MAKQEMQPVESNKDAIKANLKQEKKILQEEQKKQKKEAKVRAKEIAAQEMELDDESEGGMFSTVLVTSIIVLVWVGILCLLIKLDVGGFGSGVLTPILKNVPVLQSILPADKTTETVDGGTDYGYSSLKEAVDQIKVLELELQQAQSSSTTSTDDIATLKAEVERLKTFEDNQVEFERIKKEFYQEVVYAENGPGAEEYKKYYESMDPTTAEYLYKQVVQQLQVSKAVTDYAQAYSTMKPKEAAAIFEAMTDNLDLAAQILSVMSADSRGAILGAMDPTIAAKITKIMDPIS